MEYWEGIKNLLVKSQTVFGIVETYVFLLIYAIIYGRFAKFSDNERFGFTCENAANSVRNECLILYNKANPLFAWLILPSLFLFLPLSTWFVHGILMLWILKKARNDSNHKFHAHHLYYGQLIVRLAILFGLLAVFAVYFETFQVSSKFECSIISTLCSDSRSEEKTILNWVSFGAILLMLATTLSELIWLVCAIRRTRGNTVGGESQDGCRVCKTFSFQFLNIELETQPQGHGTTTLYGATGRREANFEDTSFAASSREDHTSELLLQHGQESSSRNGIDEESMTDGNVTEELAPSNGQESSSRNGIDEESLTDGNVTEEAAPSINAQEENITENNDSLIDCKFKGLVIAPEERNEDASYSIDQNLKDLIAGKRISQFTLAVYRRLSSLMDPSRPGIENWQKLGRYFGFSSTEISLLENGGNAHKHFFKKLRSHKPEMTLNDIKTHLENLGTRSRNEIFYKHEEKMSTIMDKQFRHFTDDEFDVIFETIAGELCETDDSRYIGCWKDLAGKIYNRTEIKYIEECGRQANYSPCEALIEILSKREETVLRFMEGLKHIGRNDVLKILKEEIIKGECWETDD